VKVAFVGKGGSGKTTVSSLFSRYLASLNTKVLVIDADINQHMAESLGANDRLIKSIQPMGIQMDKIKSYLRGDNKRIKSPESMTKTTPPGNGSNLVYLNKSNPVFDHFCVDINGIRTMAVGPFNKSDLGVKCYHSKTGAAELFLNHLIDYPNEYVLMDMTAGADSFASGLFTKFDITFLVVEPTLKSLSVYSQYKDYARDHDVRIKVIGNKVEDASDEEFIARHVGDDLITSLSRSEFVRNQEKGDFASFDKLEANNLESLSILKQAVDESPKDWSKFYRQTVEFHTKNAESWANEAAGEDLREQIDPQFDILKFV